MQCNMERHQYDMTNTPKTDSVEETLMYNLPVMAVQPMPMTTEEENFLPVEDEKMMAVLGAVIETGTLTPLIKEELKCSILKRRFVEGKEDIEVDFTVPPKKKLTEEEAERAVVRREQNRTAAQRFRQKQKDTASRLMRKTQRLESSNTQLRTELNKLRQEKDELRELLNAHLQICPVGLQVIP